MSGVVLENITKSFGKVDVLRDISLHIPDNEFTVFVGPSGCGKSTLLRLIAGLEEASSGRIFIGKKDVTSLAPAKRGISMVFQSYALYPHMSVYDNISFGLRCTKYKKEEIHKRVIEAADALQLTHLLDRKPKQLSGGQRQRVAIGRAIIKDPQAFLFDEPLSNLDAGLRVKMRLLIAKLKVKMDTTMIYVTHDQVEAMTLADKIVVLNQGHIEQVGTPLDIYTHPRNRFVASFIGSPRMNFITTHIKAVDDAHVSLDVCSNLRVPIHAKAKPQLDIGDEITLGLRPEHLTLCNEAQALFSGTVRLVEHLGSESYVYVRIDDKQELLVRCPELTTLARGDSVHISAQTARCHLFDPDTGRAFEKFID